MIKFICWLRHKLFKTEFVYVCYGYEMSLRKVIKFGENLKAAKCYGKFIELHPYMENILGKKIINGEFLSGWFYFYKNKEEK